MFCIHLISAYYRSIQLLRVSVSCHQYLITINNNSWYTVTDLIRFIVLLNIPFDMNNIIDQVTSTSVI